MPDVNSTLVKHQKAILFNKTADVHLALLSHYCGGFALKTWYKGGYNLINNEWNKHSSTVQSTRKVVYNLRNRFGSTAYCPRSGRPSLSDEIKVNDLQTIIQSPKKSTRRLSCEQNVS